MDAAELKDDELHDKRMERRARERQEKADMASENARLRDALGFAKQKLQCYYAATKGEYPGGLHFGNLMDKIDDALSSASKE